MRIDPLEILSYGEEPVDVNDLNVPDVEISPQSLCQLQLVNCRFRQLELDLPELWTYVDIETMSIPRIQLQLEHCKPLGLSLNSLLGVTFRRECSLLVVATNPTQSY